MAKSKIQWTDETWNPVRGCSRVSPGCDNCYAAAQAHRFDGPGLPYEGLTTLRRKRTDWSGRLRFVPEMLDKPLRWKRPRRIFVNSMSDLFHPSISNEQIAAVFGVMASAPQHTFQVLTKRADRMRAWFRGYEGSSGAGASPYAAEEAARGVLGGAFDLRCCDPAQTDWPLPNVHLGVSVEDQERADERIPDLLATPAAVRFVSAEPLLGPIDLDRIPRVECVGVRSVLREPPTTVWHHQRLNWVIIGGESGPGARPCDVAWIRSLVTQCREAGVAAFVKQLGAHYVDAANGIGGQQAKPDPQVVPKIRRLSHPKGGEIAEWPQDLRVREWPER